ncbi:MAG: OmpA family protein [Bacteroidota bacterium]
MRLLLSLYMLAAICVPLISYAQLPVLLRDEFRKLQPLWPVALESSQNRQFEEEQMILSQSDLTATWLYTTEQYLYNRPDFIFEASFTVLESNATASYGLCWGATEDLQQYYAFEMNTEGFFRVIKVQGKDIQTLLPWNSHRKIQPVGEENVIRVRKDEWGLYLDVNDKEVGRIKYPKFMGLNHGLMLKGQIKLSVDYWMVRHPEVIIHQLQQGWPQAVKLRLDSTINSDQWNETHPRYHPLEPIFYVSRSKPGKLEATADIWYTEKTDSTWTPLAALGSPYNDSKGNTIVRFDPNGSKVWLNGRYGSRGGGANGLSFAQVDKSTWENIQPFPLPTKLFPGQTTITDWAINENQDIVLFAAELPGGYGDMDIYVTFREGSTWSKPKNLGPSVNTFGRECSPMLLEDDETLYFASNGWPGYGKGDLFMTNRTSRTWTQWDEPMNLGPKINSAEWDAYLFPFPQKTRQYFMASIDSARGDYDIYRLAVPVDIKTQPLCRVYGQIRHIETERIIPGTIQFWTVKGEQIRKVGEAEAEKGSYGMYLDLGKAYQMYAVTDGYFPILDTLDVRAAETYRDVRKDLFVKSLELGKAVRLDNVFFHRASPELLPASYSELNRLAILMHALPHLFVEIRGHTDNVGEERALQTLSEQRAATVRQYLVDMGISGDRLSSQGFGSSEPIASNDDPTTRPLNRRVEFVIIRN